MLAKFSLLLLGDLVQIYQITFAVIHEKILSQWFAQTLVASVLLIQQQNGRVRKQRLFYFFQMSKSTGNFLTLAQAVDKFSADGKYVLTCIWFSIMPE